MASLSELRKQIDEVDKQLLALIAKRLSIATQIGKIKTQNGLPIYVPEREASILEARKEEAQKLGVDPKIIEDVLHRLMRGSYECENNIGFHCVNPNLGDIVIIGGNGQLGQLFNRLFKLSGYQVKILDQEDWANSQAIFANAGLIIISVPINRTQAVIEKLTQLPANCIVADLTSIKSRPLATMLKTHQGPVVGLHPMFAPSLSNLTKQVIVCCDGRMPKAYQWLLEQFTIWGCIVKKTTAQEHDKHMQLIQALRHFTTFSYGLHLANENPEIKQLIELSSPIYRLELMMVGRLFAQNAELYSDIIMSCEENTQMIKRYADCLKNTISLLETNNKTEFIKLFNEIKVWFGEYATNFLTESQYMLQQANTANNIPKN